MRFDRASPAARPQSIGGRGWRQWQSRHAHTAADLSKLAQHTVNRGKPMSLYLRG
jgi:hypothetical protein